MRLHLGLRLDGGALLLAPDEARFIKELVARIHVLEPDPKHGPIAILDGGLPDLPAEPTLKFR